LKSNQIKSFENLECWKACVEVRKYVSVLIKKIPVSEKYDLIDNMKRASRSAARNLLKVTVDFTLKKMYNSAGTAEVLYMKLLMI
jgi:hypothetical protein